MSNEAPPPDPTAPTAPPAPPAATAPSAHSTGPVERPSVFESAAEAFFGLYFGVAAGVIVGLVLAGRGIWHQATQNILAGILLAPVYFVICVLCGAVAGVVVGGGGFLVVALLAWALPAQKKIVWSVRALVIAAMVAIAAMFLIAPPQRVRTALELDEPPPAHAPPPYQPPEASSPSQ